MDDEQVKLLQPLLDNIVKSGTTRLDVVQEHKGKHYHVLVERKTGSEPEDDGSMEQVNRSGTGNVEGNTDA